MRRVALLLCAAACAPSTIRPTITALPGHESITRVDTEPKERRRMVPAEVYIRTYLTIFGGLAPLAAQYSARGKQGGQLFDTWDDYLSALGLPDYRIDLPRAGQTNTLMMATFERLGVALCDRAAEHDLRPLPAGQAALVFAFDAPPADGALDASGFATRFDVLHRLFLGYPAALAPPGRAARFYKLYTDVVERHAAKDAGKSLFKPMEAGWAAVCYGLVRHPEFVLY